jgi:GNAT superfamily N-acetyltransferase
LHRDNLSRTQARSLPAEIPAVLLAKLALDTSLHSRGLGADLLVDALTRCVQAGQLVASRYVVVDAINDNAAAFYRRYGFTEVPSTGAPTRLLRRLKDIAADLEPD